MHYYRQPIILFGLLLPVLATAAVLGIALKVKSDISESYASKSTAYQANQRAVKDRQKLESALARQGKDMDRWNKSLQQELASTITANLREISANLPPKEFQRTAFEAATSGGSLGAASAQKSSQIRVPLRGTYRSVQKALLELETRMPQLQLQEFRMEPNTSSGSVLLNFQVTYTAWEL